MNTAFFLVLRQMRLPLLLLSSVYAIATIGLTLIPGVDGEGELWYLDFFHAFYFVSFMGTTTGFGEIPYPFSDGQRMWALLFIYITVGTWIYSIGRLISVLSSEMLNKAISANRFQRQVRLIREPFSLICGYGDAGSKLVDAMRKRKLPATVIEIEQERVNSLVLNESEMDFPALCGDASVPDHLVMAGINHPMCRNVVALTDDNAVNLHIAITAKVLNSNVTVISRANSHDIEANMSSFGTEHIIDPFDSFARDLGLATYAPNQFLLSLWLRSEPGELLPDAQRVPEGKWIICGYGRFGQAIHKEMVSHGLSVQVIETDAGITGITPDSIIGDATGAEILLRAGVESAVGIIAGTNDDSNNLSIIVTATALNPNLFVIVRQNEHANELLFKASNANVAMEPSGVVARKIKTILTNPSIDEFLSLARGRDDRWAGGLISRIRLLSSEINGEQNVLPEVWQLDISESTTPALMRALKKNATLRIGHLLCDHTERDNRLPALVLFHSSKSGAFCLPPSDTLLGHGDKLLFIGGELARWKMGWTQNNDIALEYVLTGGSVPQSYIARWLASHLG